MTSLGLASVHFILKQVLKLTKIGARWIPHLLTDEQKRTRVQKAKQLPRKHPKYQKKVFDSLISSDETWVHFYEPRRKGDNRIWALKQAQKLNIAKRTLTAKVLYANFLRNSWPLMQTVAVPKGDIVSGSFYKNVVLKTMRTKLRKVRPKTGLQHVHLLHDSAAADTPSTAAQFLKSIKVNYVAPSKTWPRATLFFFLK